MAKKAFNRNNPAEDIIASARAEEQQEINRQKEEPIQEERELDAQQPSQQTEEPIKRTYTRSEVPKGYKLNPAFIEVKSKRVQILLQPSVLDAIKAMAKEEKLSQNEIINRAIYAYLESKGKVL